MTDLEILFEDNHLLVVAKPKGLLTQPSGTSAPSLEGKAKAYLKRRDSKPGNVFLEAVHRLDKPVSGVVLFAKTSKALQRLQAAQRSRSFRKVYHAVVTGTLPRASGTLEHYLKHGDRCAVVVDSGSAGAKNARLHYHVVATDGDMTTVEVVLETGRYHQIRAQLAAVGCPVVGDTKYGSVVATEGIALHHHSLAFPHPITKEEVVVVKTTLPYYGAGQK